MNRKGLEEIGKREVLRFSWVLVGVALYALGYRLFIAPAGLYSGGFVGISQIIRNLLHNAGFMKDTDFTGIIYWILNVPIFLIALKAVGHRFVLRTAIAISVQSLLMMLIPMPEKMLFSDYLLNSIIGGALAGVGLGILLRSGASSGGMDIIGIMMVKKYQNIRVGRLSMLVNIVIYLYAAYTYDLETAAYSMVVALVNSMMLDRTFTQTIKQTAFVVSADQKLGTKVIKNLGRGVTSWECRGEYTGHALRAYMITLDKHEIPAFHRLIEASDAHVFCTVMQPEEVIGNFKKHLDT